MIQVRWLNGEPHEHISLDDSGVRLLGKLDQEPGPVRTRRESILESDSFRFHNDISRIERQRRTEENKKVDTINAACTEVLNFLVEEVVAEVCISGSIEQADRMQTWEALNFDLIFDLIVDALIQVTDSLMDELIMEAVISVSSEYFERLQKIETMKLIAENVKVLKRNVIRRRVRNKWGHYISEELPLAKGISKLDHAARLIKLATPLLSRLKLPVSQLVGNGEVELLEKYAPSEIKSHNALAMKESISRRLVKAETSIASALGSALRDSFLDHTEFTRILYVAKNKDESHVPSVENEREAAMSIPCMSPLHTLVHNLAAPSIALRAGTEIGLKKTSKSGFEIRKEKLMCLLNNTARALNSPSNTFPVFESVGKDLSTTAPASQLNRIANDWGVSTTHSTAIAASNFSGDVYTEAFKAELATHQGDVDVHSIRNTSDNVGQGAAS